jgi:hypothetical protein
MSALCKFGCRDSAVSTVGRLRPGLSGVGIQAGKYIYEFYKTSRLVLWPKYPPLQRGSKAVPWGKAVGS